VIEDNTAVSDGGGIWVSTTGYLMVDDGTLITSNIADDGAGICLDGAADADLLDASIFDNVASSEGGGLYFQSGDVTADSVDFLTNSADDGGGIWLDTGSITVTTGSVFGNVATGNGGGVHIEGDGTFDADTVDFDGTADNSPTDVEVHTSGATWDAYSYGAAASFMCTLGACTP
jgi:hypothetical protein